MKKTIFILFALLSISFSIFSQNEKQESEMQSFEQELNKAFNELSEMLGNSNFPIDSLIFSEFDRNNIPHQDEMKNQFNQIFPEGFSLNEMFNLMQSELSKINEKDLQEMEHFFREFSEGELPFLFEEGELLEKDEENNTPKKKKRKVTTL